MEIFFIHSEATWFRFHGLFRVTAFSICNRKRRSWTGNSNTFPCCVVTNVFCVNRWHSNRYYTINQGTEQRRDTKLKLSTRTAGILVVSLGTDFFVEIRPRLYSRWNGFCVNRWHSNRYYTINQGKGMRRDTTLIRVLFKLETCASFLVSSYLYRWW